MKKIKDYSENPLLIRHSAASAGNQPVERGAGGRHMSLTQVEPSAALADLQETKPERVTIVVLSGDMDRVMAAFIIATGAAAMGMPVTMFFTFWGLNAIRKPGASTTAKDLLRRRDLALTEVAERVGYGSASAFSTAFTRAVGQPPSRYARAFS